MSDSNQDSVVEVDISIEKHKVVIVEQQCEEAGASEGSEVESSSTTDPTCRIGKLQS